MVARGRSGAFWAFEYAWWTEGVTFGVVSCVSLVNATVPAFQVRLLSTLLGAHASGRVMTSTVVLLVVVVGCSQMLASVASRFGLLLANRVEARAKADLARAASGMAPSDLMAADRLEELDLAKQSLPIMGMLPASVLSVVSAAVTSGSLVWAIWYLSPPASLAVACALVPTIVAYTVVARMARRFWKANSRPSRLGSYCLDLLTASASGTELLLNGDSPAVARLADESWETSRRMVLGYYAKATLVDLPAGMCTAVVVGAGLLLLSGGPAGAAGAAAGAVAVISGVAATSNAGNALGRVFAGGVEVEQLRGLLTAARCRGEATAREAMPVTMGADLVVEGVTYRYPGSATNALDSVSLSVADGQMVALVGANGSGKTTLVGVILGVHTPCSGLVRLGGVRQSDVEGASWRRVFRTQVQDPTRFEFTFRQAVTLGAGAVEDEQVWRALRNVELASVVERSGGLDASLGLQWGGVNLSGGEWQRLALARALLRPSEVLMLDEPTSAVDAETEERIFARLRTTASAGKIVVVSHRAWTLRDMDVIHVMDGGRLVESGTFEGLLAQRGRFFELFKNQVMA